MFEQPLAEPQTALQVSESAQATVSVHKTSFLINLIISTLQQNQTTSIQVVAIATNSPTVIV